MDYMVKNPHPSPEERENSRNDLCPQVASTKGQNESNNAEQIRQNLDRPNGSIVGSKNVEELLNCERYSQSTPAISILIGPTLRLTGSRVYPHFILRQPDRIRVSSNKLIYIDSTDRGQSLDSFLLAVNKDCHVFLRPSLLLCFLGGCQFPFGPCCGGMVRIGSGNSACPYLPSYGCYTVVDKITFILPIKN